MWNQRVLDVDSPLSAELARPTPGESTLLEQRARALAPTVYCPPTRVEQCLAGSDIER